LTPQEVEERLRIISTTPTDEYVAALKQQMVEILEFPLPVSEVMARAAIAIVAAAMLSEETKDQQQSLCCTLSFAMLAARNVWERGGHKPPYMTIRESAADEPENEKNEDAEIREIDTAQPASGTKH
jgi:hypothetical protein